MSTFKGIALLSLIFVAQKSKISVTQTRELEVAKSQISYKYANYCSFLIFLFVWIGTDYLGKRMALSHFLCYVFSTQQSAHCCSQSIARSPIPGKNTPLGQLGFLAIKNMPFQIPFSPKSFGLDISYGRFPEKQATDGSTDPSFIISHSLLKLYGFCCCVSLTCDRIWSETGEEKLTCSLTVVLEQVQQVPLMIQLVFAVYNAS